MRVIVAGGRDFDDKARLYNILDLMFLPLTPSCPVNAEILCGMARGADALGEQWAVTNWVKLTEYPADWDKHGKKAGFLRNEEMAQNADILVAFWDGKSKGTNHMITTALKHGLEVHVYRYNQ